ncbi:MAG: hypothetical protein ACXWBP_13125, partial [Limisphaerales bacterium]
VCTACHDPHHPKFPGRKPAPGPHLLHPVKEEKHQTPNAKETSNSKSQNSNQPVTVTWSLKFGLFI